ncbi:MAG: MmgE/PrpD family protein [Proteobacteria bacterium]|nr:MmgE/PrpD family protein [Pseudomonadota bacterium]
MALANDLAERIAGFGYEQLSPTALAWAKVAIADTLAVTVAGACEPCVERLERALALEPSEGPCVVVGRGRRAGALHAALVNGTAAHALDFDDTSKSMGGHPSAPLLPVLLAGADAFRASGRQVLAAYAVGFETECKLGRAVNFQHYEKGWHPTATLGTIGAAAAAARLLGLDEPAIATALAIAVSFASGVKANFGTMTKPLHVGHAARNGLLAALLAREGFDAQTLAFEHRQGFFEVFNGRGAYDAAKALAGWGAPPEIESPGVGLKQYPSCASTHAPVDALLAILRRERLGHADVAEVGARVHPRRFGHIDRPDPANPLEAKFSLVYCLARALVDGTLAPGHFQAETHRDPVVRTVMGRIRTGPFPADAPETANQFAAEVTVRTTDGRTLVERIDQAVGRGPEKPIPEAAFRAKFEDCTRPVLGAEAAARLYELAIDLERMARAAALTDLIAAAAPAPSYRPVGRQARATAGA